MKQIPFFMDTIVIAVHSATLIEHTGKNISLADFCNRRPMSLHQLDNGDYYASMGKYPNIIFIEGPEK